jgi:hypothetical protein
MSTKWILTTDTGDDTVEDREFDTEEEAKRTAEEEAGDCGPVEWHANADGGQTGDPTGTDSAAGWWYELTQVR